MATLWLYSSAPVVYKNVLVFPSTFSELEGEQSFALHTSSNEQQTREKHERTKETMDNLSLSVLINGFHKSTRILSAGFRASTRAMFTSFSTLVSEWSHISAFTVRKFLTNI